MKPCSSTCEMRSDRSMVSMQYSNIWGYSGLVSPAANNFNCKCNNLQMLSSAITIKLHALEMRLCPKGKGVQGKVMLAVRLARNGRDGNPASR